MLHLFHGVGIGVEEALETDRLSALANPGQHSAPDCRRPGAAPDQQRRAAAAEPHRASCTLQGWRLAGETDDDARLCTTRV